MTGILKFINFDERLENHLKTRVKTILSNSESNLDFEIRQTTFLNCENYCLYDLKGKRINKSAIKRGIGANPTLDSKERIDLDVIHKTNVKIKDCVYLGPLFFHFGHFLLESTARMWSIFENFDKDKFCFILHTRLNMDKAPDFIKLFLSKLDNYNVKVIDGHYNNKLIELNNVYIPDPALIADYRINSKFTKIFEYIASSVKQKKSPISKSKICYLSRLKLSSNLRTAVGENNLVSMFKDHVDIICPEQHNIMDQIKIFGTFDTLIGIIGSGFHNLLFVKNKTVTYITDESPNINFLVIDIILGNRAYYVNSLIGNSNTLLKHRLPKALDLKTIYSVLNRNFSLMESVPSNLIDSIQINLESLNSFYFKSTLDSLESSPILTNRFSSLFIQKRFGKLYIEFLQLADDQINGLSPIFINSILDRQFKLSELNNLIDCCGKLDLSHINNPIKLLLLSNLYCQNLDISSAKIYFNKIVLTNNIYDNRFNRLKSKITLNEEYKQD